MLPMRIRSMVGLIPLFAVAVVDQEMLEKLPGLSERMTVFFTSSAATSRRSSPAGTTRVPATRHLLSLARVFRMTKLFERMLDEDGIPVAVTALAPSPALISNILMISSITACIMG